MRWLVCGAGGSLVRFCTIVLISLLNCAPARGQQTGATVGFTLDFQGANPSHYEIVVSSDGSGSYSSNGQLSQESEPADPAPLKFTLSGNIRNQIFDLAKKTNYFKGKIDSGHKNIANTGNKVLTYKDATHNSRAEYNYSPVPVVQEITAVFQNMSSTLEFGRRLDYYHHHQKLALEDELKRMEEMAKEKNLEEIQAVAPILQRIVDDKSVLNITRARAQRLLNRPQAGAS